MAWIKANGRKCRRAYRAPDSIRPITTLLMMNAATPSPSTKNRMNEPKRPALDFFILFFVLGLYLYALV